MTENSEKKLKKPVKAFSITAELKQQIDAICEDLKTTNRAETDEDVLSILIDAFNSKCENPTPPNDEEITKVLNEKNAQIETHSSRAKALEARLESLAEMFKTKPMNLETTCTQVMENYVKLEASAKAKLAENEQLNAEIVELESQINQLDGKISELRSALEIAEYQQKNSENNIVIDFTPQEFQLVKLTIERIKERRKIGVLTPSNLLRTMFLRYTIERQCEWFYRHELKDKEIEQITGKTIAEWKKYFNS